MNALAEVIRERARSQPDDLAFLAGDETLTWAEYDTASDGLARLLVELGFEPGERLAVLLPDGASVHAAYVAAEKAGLVVVGIAPRTGLRELEHLLRKTGACGLLSRAHHQGVELGAWLREVGIPLRQHFNDIIDECERLVLLNALKENGWNKSRVTKALGIPRQSLYNKIAKYDLKNDSPSGGTTYD